MIVELLEAILFICGMFAIGLVARTLGYLKDFEVTRISRFVIDFLFPMLVFNTVTQHLNDNSLSKIWILPVIGFGLIAVGAILGWIFKMGLRGKDREVEKTFIHMCAVNNFGFIPIILIQNLWGEAALAQLFFLHLGSNIGLWTIGVGILGTNDLKNRLKNIFSPVLVSILFASVIGLCGWKPYIPDLVTNIIAEGGTAAVPIMLILIGASYYHTHLFQFKVELLYLSFVRLVAIPLIYIFILRLLPLSREVYHIAVTVSLMPTAMATAILTRRFSGNSEYAAAAAIVTMLFSLGTIPAAFMILF